MTRLVWMAAWGPGLGCAQEPVLRDRLPPVQVGQPLELGPRVQVDRVLQVVNPSVDVLWVLDSSCSMDTEHDAMAKAFPGFISPFVNAGLDYHVGVTTTDVTFRGAEGRLMEAQGVRWIDPTMKNAAVVFQEMATEAIQLQQHEEKGLMATYLALGLHSKPGGFNEGFARRPSNVWMHVTVMSDEDDQSEREQLYTHEFIDFMNDLKPLPSRVTFNSIVSFVDGVDYSVRGRTYMEVSDALGGEIRDLQGGDWTQLMTELGGLQAPEPTNEFFLSRLPVPETIEVRAVTPESVTLVYLEGQHYGYDVQRNSVRFVGDLLPPLGSEVQIIYEVRAARDEPTGGL